MRSGSASAEARISAQRAVASAPFREACQAWVSVANFKLRYYRITDLDEDRISFAAPGLGPFSPTRKTKAVDLGDFLDEDAAPTTDYWDTRGDPRVRPVFILARSTIYRLI